MKRLTVDDLRAVLPDLDELRPLADHLVSGSEADPARAWSGSGQLGTAGSRLVRTDGLGDAVDDIVGRERERLEWIYRLVAEAVEAVADGEPATAVERFLEAADLEETADHPERAAAYADAAYRLAREGSQPALTSLALRRRARHRRAIGRHAEAERDYQEAFVVARAVDDARGAAEALIGAGNVFEEQARWDEAAEWYRRALEVLESVDGPAPERWHALLNLHVVLRSVGSLDDCLASLQRAAEIAEAIVDDTALPFLENARGQYRMAVGDFEAAEEHLRRAVEASRGARAEITIRLNLAETLFAMGRTLDAAEEARRAERMAITSTVPQKLPEVYRLLGRIAASEDVPDAFVLFERALEIIAEHGLPTVERAQTLQAYAEAEGRVGDPETAGRLLAEADRLYGELGIDRRRRPWADRFDREAAPPEPQDPESQDPGSQDPEPKQNEGTEREGTDDEQ